MDFVVGLVAIVLLTNTMFSLGLLELLVFVAYSLILGDHRDDFGWLFEEGGFRENP